ncbi:MAG: alpha/beta hydrolase [Salinarimonadaceae bacterium]|nr:MAG: alpha/beta hydrolase [Salinarimonadaceae bacterium]
MTETDESYRSLFISASDGLRLHARDYGPIAGALTPVVCLPGLTRNAIDFHDLALAFSQGERPRRTLAVDYRGRGLSDRDSDWRRYDLQVELDDLLQVLAATNIPEAVFVGASRGGLITMALAAVRPAAIRAVVLNDIGPVIEPQGLMRIRGYVGKMPKPRNFDDAIAILKTVSDRQFPALDDEGWRKIAEGVWHSRNGKLELSYDPALMKGLTLLDLEKPLPTLWPLFDALKHAPTLAIRGAHSDLLSGSTLAAMAKRHPRFESLTVEGQGHTPLLDGVVAERIVAFVDAREISGRRQAVPEPAMPRADAPLIGGA